MRELEAWLALEIIAYHSDLHRGIGRPPVAAWNEAISDYPRRQVLDPLAFLIDFLPFEARVLRRTGIHLNNICYWSDGFAPWIGRCEDKVLVKYDPRDLHRVFVKLGDNYLMVPTRNPVRPAITLWSRRQRSACSEPAAATRSMKRRFSRLSLRNVHLSIRRSGKPPKHADGVRGVLICRKGPQSRQPCQWTNR